MKISINFFNHFSLLLVWLTLLSTNNNAGTHVFGLTFLTQRVRVRVKYILRVRVRVRVRVKYIWETSP